VGVQLEVPGDYAARRRRALDQAIEAAVDRGASLSREGRFNDALGRMDRAADRWQPSAGQRARINEARLDTYLAWSEHEARQGRYRAAYNVTERALSSLGRDFPRSRELLAMQERALEEGTVRVAVLPVTSQTGVDDELPVDWLREVEDALEENAWDEPPMFVQVIDPREVRREMRRVDGGRRSVGGTSQAANVGRALGADLVVRMVVDSTRTEERDVRTERRTARLRTGQDTAYTVRSGRRQVWARVRYDIIDVRERRSVSDDVFHAEGEARFREPVFQGNWRQLALSRDEAALFGDDARRDQRHQLWRSLADRMTERAGRELFDRILRLVD
jgi:tetratricopeptide (TPR) repeat protein